MLKRFTLMLTVMIVVCTVMNLAVLMGFAQELPSPVPSVISAPADAWYKPLLQMLMFTVLPAFWSAIGPVATGWITKQANKLQMFVPRELQVIVSGALMAAVAGFTGDPTLIMQAAGGGAAGQIIAATNPATLRTEAAPVPASQRP